MRLLGPLLVSVLLFCSCATSSTTLAKRSAGSDSRNGGSSKETRPGDAALPKPGNCGQFKEFILETSKQQGLEPELVMGVIQVESGYNPGVTSRVGASGLMQVMPGTAKHMKCGSSLTDPESNIQCGCKVLRRYLDLYNGNLVYALSAYNAGPGNTNPSKEEGKAPFNFAYVEKVLRWRNVFVRLGCN